MVSKVELPAFPVVNGLTVPKIVTQDQVDQAKRMKFYPDDLWIVSYPKAGTTWTQQIVKLIHSRGEDDGRRINEAVLWIEALNNSDHKYDDYNIDISSIEPPRAFKSHFTYECLPCGPPNTSPCKFIYVTRNPKDVAVSYFHHYSGFKYVEDLQWEDFILWFLSGQVAFGDYFDHVLSWWAHREEDNVMILKYEDMKKDLHGSIQQISQFMGIELSSTVVDKIAEKSSFSSMKKDPSANYTWADHRRAPGAAPFLRKGEIGNWKEYFTPEQSKTCDELYESKLKSVGLEFDFVQGETP